MFARRSQAAEPRQGEDQPPFGIGAGCQHLSGVLTTDEVDTRLVRLNHAADAVERIRPDQPFTLRRAEELWTALGCRVSGMSPESHDAAFAAVSHLPHLLAFAMIQSITGQEESDHFLSLAGPGFRDFTRIAASDPKMWRDILRANRHDVLSQSRHFQQALQAFEQAMQSDNDQALEDMITLASETRAHWRMGAQRTKT